MGGHMSRHKQITLHIKYKEPHVFLSPHHNHFSHHDAKAVVHRVCCHSPVTICHNYSHYRVLSCTAHTTCLLAVCLVMWSARGECILPVANVSNIRLHLVGAWGPECCFHLGWPSWPSQTCVAAWTLHLKSCGKQHCFFIGAVMPTKQIKS
jgi:hypothetical protein